MESITKLAIQTVETITPHTTKGYLAAIDTYKGMLEDSILTSEEIKMIEDAADKAFKEGQKLQLQENQKAWAGDLNG